MIGRPQRPTFAEYIAWHQRELGEDLSADAIRQSYEMNVRLAVVTLTDHVFTRRLSDTLNELGAEGFFAVEPELAFRRSHLIPL